MPRAQPPSPAEVLRRHYTAVAELVGQGAAETAIGAALSAAETAGLNRTALAQAVREGRIADGERRAVIRAELDRYRAMMEPAPALAVPRITDAARGRP